MDLQERVRRALERTTDTKDLVIGKGVLSQSAALFRKMFPGQKAVIVADLNTWRVAGEQVAESLRRDGVTSDEPFIFTDPDLYAEWKFVLILKERLEKSDAIAIAVGSGVINDLVKYVSHLLGRKYMCVGTAASMDGFTSYGASITKDGNKQTFNCPAPYAFLMDPVIAANAPKEMAASGYADLIAKIPAGADWMLARIAGTEQVDGFSWSLVQDGLRESLSAPAEVFNRNVETVEQLCSGLLMSGFAMQALQSSRPASGTEHQFSHCWDMENLSYADGRHVSHGFKVGIGTLVSTAVLEFLVGKELDKADIEACVSAWPQWYEVEKHLARLFDGKPNHLTRAMKETKDKYVTPDGLRAQLEAIQAAWPEARKAIAAQIIPFDQVKESLRLVGAPYEPEMIGISRARLRRTFRYIPFMRSRFTGIDVAYRFCLMDELEERLFGKGGYWEVQ